MGYQSWREVSPVYIQPMCRKNLRVHEEAAIGVPAENVMTLAKYMPTVGSELDAVETM